MRYETVKMLDILVPLKLCIECYNMVLWRLNLQSIVCKYTFLVKKQITLKSVSSSRLQIEYNNRQSWLSGFYQS